MALAYQLKPADLDDVLWRARYFSIELSSETPMKLHSQRDIGYDGAPRMTDEFERYLENALSEAQASRRSQELLDLRDPVNRRVTRAFRKLRNKAPREYDVLWRMCALDQVGKGLRHNDFEGMGKAFHDSLSRTKRRFNQKTPDHTFNDDEVLLLAVSGLRKLVLWAG